MERGGDNTSPTGSIVSARPGSSAALPPAALPDAPQKRSLFHLRFRSRYVFVPTFSCARKNFTKKLLFCAAPEVAHGLGRFGVVHPGPPMGLSSFLGRFGRRTARKARLGPAAVAAPGSARGDRYFPLEPRFRPAPTPGFGPFSRRGGAFASFPASAPLPCPLHDLLIPVLTTGGSITPLTSLECISICPSPHTSPIRRTLGWKKALEVI